MKSALFLSVFIVSILIASCSNYDPSGGEVSYRPLGTHRDVVSKTNSKRTAMNDQMRIFKIWTFGALVPIFGTTMLLSSVKDADSKVDLSKLHNCLGLYFTKYKTKEERAGKEQKLYVKCPFKARGLMKYYKKLKAENPEELAVQINKIEKLLKDIEKNEENRSVKIKAIRERINGTTFIKLEKGTRVDWLGGFARSAILDRLYPYEQKPDTVNIGPINHEMLRNSQICMGGLLSKRPLSNDCLSVFGSNMEAGIVKDTDLANYYQGMGLSLDVANRLANSFLDIKNYLNEAEERTLELERLVENQRTDTVLPSTLTEEEYEQLESQCSQAQRFIDSVRDRLGGFDGMEEDFLGKTSREAIERRIRDLAGKQFICSTL